MISTASTSKRIIAAASTLFLRYGYSRVTIDDIVRELAMSKKTVYNHFINKSAILTAFIEDFVHTYREQAGLILENPLLSFQEKLNLYLRHIGLSFTGISQELMQDIKRSEPKAWEKLCIYRRDVLKHDLGRILDEGVDAGYIRNDPSRYLAILGYIGAIEQLDDPDFVAQFPASFVEFIPKNAQDRADQLIHLLLHGLMTPLTYDQ